MALVLRALLQGKAVGITGALESHHCLPHTDPHLPPKGSGYKVKGQEQPPSYRGKVTLVSISL